MLFATRERPGSHPAFATIQIEPVVLFRGQREERLLERPLYGTKHVPTRPFFLGPLLIRDDLRKARLERR